MSEIIYRNTVEYVVYGRNALFSDVLTRSGGEKCTHPIPTYEAIKGITNSIYWKPTFYWVIDSVRVINPIRTVRKGVRPIIPSGGNELSYYTYLDDVCYQVRAHFEWKLNRPELEADRIENKHHNIAKRMIERGGRRDIFLGTRECQGYVGPCVFGEGKGAYDNSGTLSFGLMYHGITYADEAINDEDKGMLTTRFWNPQMVDGVIKFIRPEECTIKRNVREMKIKPFGRDLENFIGLEEFEGGEFFELD